MARSVKRKIARIQTEDISNRQPESRFLLAIRMAKKRCVKWNLTLRQYKILIAKPCVYCGQQKHESGIGLDRIDNDKGYVPGNVSPCCFACNMMRGSLPVWLFLKYVRLIAWR